MDKLILFIYFLLLTTDSIVLSDARRLLLDFLIGQRNRKNANKIHKQQSFQDKVTMRYIKPMLKKNVSAFKNYHLLYMILLISLIPQYIVIVLAQILLPDYVWCVFCFFLAIKFILAVYYRLELGSLKMSVYAQKKK